MQDLKVIEVKGKRVLTTHQIAEAYKVKEVQISQNFKNNRERFIDGKHYIPLSGDELKAFKNQFEKIEVVKNRTSHLYLWTEKGALLHAKSLNTDKAWDVYDYLVDFYFRAKEDKLAPTETKPIPVEKPKQELQFPQTNDPIGIFRILLQVADDEGIKVRSFPFKGINSVLHSNHIGIRQQMLLEKVNYELAWELAHLFIHYDNGDLIKSPLQKDYNAQATRAANMIIKMLNVKMK